MSITVRFSKNGFYHPAFGRMGLGKYAGDIYTLPDLFAEEGMLPSATEIITELEGDDFEELLDDQGQRKPHKPKVVDEAQMKIAKERVAKAKAKKEAAKKPAAKTAAKPAAKPAAKK